jgi:predicted CopG family antitoxin
MRIGPIRKNAYSSIVIVLWLMTTTVQVRDQTRRLLDRLKRQLGLRSYDEVIQKLAKPRTGTPDSLFGACRGSHPFVRETEDEHAL